MVKKLNNEINNLIEEIKNTPTYKEYIKYKKLVLEDEEIREKYEQIDRLKKNMTNAKHYGLSNQYECDMQEYKKLESEISDNVLLTLFFASQDELKRMIERIFDYLSSDIQNELFGNAL